MRSLLGALLFFPATLGASAQDYPNKPITLVVPSTAGGGNDIIARFVADGLSRRLAQPVVVENRPGAGEAVGLAYVVNAAPDGYTIGLGTTGGSMAAAVMDDITYDMTVDLAPITVAAQGQLVLVANAGLGITTASDLVEASRSNGMFVGAGGPASPAALLSSLFVRVAGAQFDTVNYAGGSEIMVDLMGGRLEAYFGTLTTVLPAIQSEQVKALAVLTEARSPQLPDVPTIAEAGYPEAQANFWYGIFAPAGTPEPIVALLQQEIDAVMSTDIARESLAKSGAIPSAIAAKDFPSALADDIQTWRDLSK